MKRLIVISGASGLLGRSLIQVLSQNPDNAILPLSRHPENSADFLNKVAADSLKEAAGDQASAFEKTPVGQASAFEKTPISQESASEKTPAGQEFASEKTPVSQIYPFLSNEDFLNMTKKPWLTLAHGRETVLLHLAFAKSSDPEQIHSSLDFFYRVMTKACDFHFDKLINISSQSVYDPERKGKAMESDPLKPAKLYGLAKAYSEYWLEGLAKSMAVAREWAAHEQTEQEQADQEQAARTWESHRQAAHDQAARDQESQNQTAREQADHDQATQEHTDHVHAKESMDAQREQGPEWTSIRLASLIGPGDSKRLPVRLVRSGLESGKITIQDSGSLFSFLDVQDAAEGLAAFIPTKDWDSVYNLGTEETYTIEDLAQEAILFLLGQGKKADLIRKVGSGHGTSNALNSSAFYVKSRWQPRFSLPDSLRRAIRPGARP